MGCPREYYHSGAQTTWHVIFWAIAWTTIAIPCDVDKSPQLTARSDTRRCNLRGPDLQLQWLDLKIKVSMTVVPPMASMVICPSRIYVYHIYEYARPFPSLHSYIRSLWMYTLACARASKSQTAVKSSGLDAHSSYGRAVEVLAWSSIAQSVCEWAFSLLADRCLETSRFESCIQQRKTTCLLSIRISLACARASKLTTTVCLSIIRVASLALWVNHKIDSLRLPRW